jgi:hypothetical protein
MHKKMLNLINLFEDFLLKYPHGKQEEILPWKVSVNFLIHLQFSLKNILSVNYLMLYWSSVENILKLLNKIESFKENSNSRDFFNPNAIDHIKVKNIRLYFQMDNLIFILVKYERKSNLKYEKNKNQLRNQTEIFLVWSESFFETIFVLNKFIQDLKEFIQNLLKFFFL